MTSKLKLKLLLATSLLIVPLTILTACVEEDSGQTIDNSTTSVISKDGQVQDKIVVEKKTLSVKHDISVDGKNIPVTTSYAIDKDRLNNWKFTYQSVIDLSIKQDSDENQGKYDLKVNNVYSDVSIIGSKLRTNGIRQDSLNMSYNTLPLGGVDFNATNAYTIPFQVEGMNQTETSYYAYNGYGSSETSRITESDLQEHGALGAKLNVVWSILVTDKETGHSYVQTVTDKIGLPTKTIKDTDKK